MSGAAWGSTADERSEHPFDERDPIGAARGIVLEADGGSRGNPGPAGYGALIRDAATGKVLAEAAESIGVATNNVAEYRGLIAGLQLYAAHAPGADLEVRMDSKLVVEQMAGRWKVKHPDMRPLAIAASRLAPPGTRWTWVPRERNKDADRLANLAMDAAARGERYVVAVPPGDVGSAGEVRPEADPPGDPTPRSLEPPAAGSGATAGVRASATTMPRTEEGIGSTPVLGWADTDPASTVILLRHGVTRHTAQRRFSGPGGDDPGMTAEGYVQAERAAAALVSDGGVDVVLASPLRRTRETAAVVAEALGLSITLEDDFRECAFGAWDGLTLAEVSARWPAELERWLASFDSAPPGGEAVAAVRDRVEAALARTLSSYAGKTVVVVSHVTPIKLCVRRCLDLPLESINKLLLAPASFTTMSFYESGATALRSFSAVP